jgi:hypothetical protein
MMALTKLQGLKRCTYLSRSLPPLRALESRLKLTPLLFTDRCGFFYECLKLEFL